MTKKHTAFASQVFDAPLGRVWSFFDDFNGMATFHPGVLESRLESGGDGRTTGAERYLVLPDHQFVRERLTKFEPSAFEFEYTIFDTSLPVRNYVAGVRLIPVTATGQTFGLWWADFTTEGADLREVASGVSENVFAAGFRAIAERLRG
ncbi:SRPBCC family protein [Burkholderia sp. FERM BP-3421]|jgi:hypothetical protein|uniref:SRPBCC family protein n=1 Tax=Burkholderia sp. FERM BP-3421 TaxID=1494466 RepID=UPI00235E9081|nr:SRPBCC family protein [Burkholderia sp. FERM BP-3421]WDD91427.1 SRPBCC family protein [Burkholderia sp. FERM BP-3421]